MTCFDPIQDLLVKTGRRWWLDHVLAGVGRGLLALALIWLLSLALYKVAPVPVWTLLAGGILGLLALVTFTSTAMLKRPPAQATARLIDQRSDLQERLSTALELANTPARPGTEGWRELIVQDAAAHAEKVDPSAVVPVRLPPAARWALLALLVAAGLGFVPEYRSSRYLQQQKDAANIRDTGRQLTSLARRNLEVNPPALVPTQKALTAVAEAGQELLKAGLTKPDALRDLANVADKLNAEMQNLERTPLLQRLERSARESTAGADRAQAQRQLEDLQKRLGLATPEALDQLKRGLDQAARSAAALQQQPEQTPAAREQLAQALGALAQQARDLGHNLAGLDQAIRALESQQIDSVLRDLQVAAEDLEKLRDLARQAGQLQQQIASTGKDLAEQLQRSQTEAAQASLQRMIRELSQSNLSPEQLQKILDEVNRAVNPAAEYGKVRDLLQDAVTQMKQNASPAAAGALAEAAKELQRLAQQAADAQALAAMMDALERAQAAIANGQSWTQSLKAGRCSSCKGAGCSQCKGTGWGQGNRHGAGVGTWADETGWSFYPEKQVPVDNSGVQRPDLDPRGLTDRGPGELSEALKPTKVKGQMTPGAPMPSLTLKGVSIRGQSTVAFQDAAAAAQADAQSALNQDQVPRPYRETVRDYFDDLK